jgi:hypothetical protein
MDVRGRDVALAVDDAGATYPVTIDPTFGQEQVQLRAPDGASYANFGTSVAISGDTVVVGADDANAAYVFVRSGANWVLEQELSEDDDGVGGDGFGVSVAIHGNTIIVGALAVDLYKDDGVIISDVGAAYVYDRTGTLWSRTQRLTASDGGRNFYFGSSVAISGDTAIVAAQSAAQEV